MEPSEQHMIPEVRERIARLEVKLDYVIAHMESLPASPETIKKLENITAQLDTHAGFINNLKGKMAVAAAGFVLMGSLMSIAVKWVFEHVQLGWGAN